MTAWYVLCSGPSLTPEDIERVRAEKDQGRAVVIATNSTAFHAPFVDYCFAMDNKWLKHFRGKVQKYDFEVISTHKNCPQYGARYVGPLDGKNSGERAIYYAWKEGGDPIIILGWDCGWVGNMAHHFGDHPPELQNAAKTQNWPSHAKTLAQKLKGRRVISCSPHSETGLECITLEEYLGY